MKEGDVVVYAEKGILFIFECESIRTITTNGVCEMYVFAVPGSVYALPKGRRGKAVRDADIRYPYYACRLAFLAEKRVYEKAAVV